MTAAEFEAAVDASGLTLVALARRWGVHRVTLHRWLKGDLPVPAWVPDALRGMSPAGSKATPPAAPTAG